MRVKHITDEQWFEFLYYMLSIKKISASYQRQIVGSIKLFYKEIYNRDIPLKYLKVSQFERKLPVVLSQTEIKNILDNINNIKHRAMITLIYASGLRIGELINLKKQDIDSDRMTVHIRDAKGKKDRYTILSIKALDILRQYYLQYKPVDYLFEGQKGGKYSTASARQVFSRALKKAGIHKKATLHTLRHSFATHLLEKGISIAYIQKLLGHTNIKTTLIYTQIAQNTLLDIKSPMDDI
jgi:integrase/recombinase XerD